MPRINHVKAARKAQRDCESCREPIPVGAAYKWVKSRYGPKRVRHATCPTWRPSELTGAKIATAYAGQEAAHDALAAIDPYDFVADGEFDADGYVEAVKEAVRECESAAEECAADYQDGIDSMPDTLQDSPTAEESREKIDALEQWGSECADFEPSAVYDPPERDDEDDEDAADADADDDESDYEDRLDRAISEFADEVRGEAEDVIDGLAL